MQKKRGKTFYPIRLWSLQITRLVGMPKRHAPCLDSALVPALHCTDMTEIVYQIRGSS